MSDGDITSGVWFYREELGEIVSVGSGVIADVCVNGDEDANGRLMAASPQLLEALQRLYNWYDKIYGDDCDYSGDHPIAVAKAAIKKATKK